LNRPHRFQAYALVPEKAGFIGVRLKSTIIKTAYSPPTSWLAASSARG
jgi:hypothetical protein